MSPRVDTPVSASSPTMPQWHPDASFRYAPIGTALVGLDGRWLAVNRALCRLLGRTETDLLDTDFPSVTHPEDLESDSVQLQQALDGETESYEVEKRYLLPDGDVLWALVSVAVVRDEHHRPSYCVYQLQDITARKRADGTLLARAERLHGLGLTDLVGGLRSRRDFDVRLVAELAAARDHDRPCTLVLFVLDGLRSLTDYAAAESAMRVAADAIASTAAAPDLAFRLGTDRFALVVPHADGTDPAAAHDATIVEMGRITDRAAATGSEALSFGVSTSPIDGTSKELLLLRADMQLTAARLAATREGPTRPAADQDVIDRIVTLARRSLQVDVRYVADRDATAPAAAAGSSAGGHIDASIRPSDGTSRGVLRANHDDAAGQPHDVSGRVREQQLALLQSFADLLSDELERRARSSTERRAAAEHAGIRALLSAMLARDLYPREHSEDVVGLATRVAGTLGLSPDRVRDVEQVALLHDIGKVGISDQVLQKPGDLSAAEAEVMRQHPMIGARILAGTETLTHLSEAVGAEHEHYDGGGYPNALSGEEIPLASRIVLACDAYHAMSRDRPYRRAMETRAVQAELRAEAGKQFDPRVVDALLVTTGAEPTRRPRADDDPDRDVLSGGQPSFVPGREPHGGPRATTAYTALASCQRCGADVTVTVNQASVGGQCGNCGSYELTLIDGTARRSRPERH